MADKPSDDVEEVSKQMSRQSTPPAQTKVGYGDTIPLDLDDPHRAAIEDNPEEAKKLTPSTVLAVAVGYAYPLTAKQCADIASR